jgi:hypothetical protein
MIPLELIKILLLLVLLWACMWLFVVSALIAAPFALFFWLLWRMDAAWLARSYRRSVDRLLYSGRRSEHR